MTADISRIKQDLAAFDFSALFIDRLGWNHFPKTVAVLVDGEGYTLRGIAEKAGFGVFRCAPAPDGSIPPIALRRKIDAQLAKLQHEHLLVFTDRDQTEQVWFSVRRQPGKSPKVWSRTLRRGESGELLAQKLRELHVTLDEEFAGIDIATISQRVHGAMDVEKVTKKFYDRYQKEHQNFRSAITGIDTDGDRDWYTSVMLNRLMFIYFIQKKGLLDDDVHYLRNRLSRTQASRGAGRFLTFYRGFLRELFERGLGAPERSRDADLTRLIGKVPYLNGGLFALHELERRNPAIDVPDDAFAQVFGFFDEYQWSLDESGKRGRADNEIDPDVLGYIFEKYINQKDMGAYYTKEDITGYICQNTIIPAVVDQARTDCRVAFRPDSALWSLLSTDPDAYIHDAVKHGVDIPLPPDIAAGIDDITCRGGWNVLAPEDFGLPTETWRDHIARRARCQDLRERLEASEVTHIDQLITLNLDIQQFAKDAILGAEGPDLVWAFYESLRKVTVLDPACGSGAFLFAALNILEPLYQACLDRMHAFVEESGPLQNQPTTSYYSRFQDELRQIDSHRNPTYYVLKSIMLRNLYGVDIMEEAVEICRLRLFLKLVAQLDSGAAIEPLPDIDFNIRAGNSLVGFVSESEIEDAVTLTATGQKRMPSAEEAAALKRLTEAADEAARAAAKFQLRQLQLQNQPGEATDFKDELNRRLADIDDRLDEFLALGGRTQRADSAASAAGLAHSLHWFADFHRAMAAGGFDVIVGNPPYITMRKIDYWFDLRNKMKLPDIYGYMMLRSLQLLKPDGRIGLIVPMSLAFSGDFAELRDALVAGRDSWLSSFDIIPASLFSGVNQRCTIWLAGPQSSRPSQTTRMHRWRSSGRDHLFSTLLYTDMWPTSGGTFGFAKHGFPASSQLLSAIVDAGSAKRARRVVASGQATKKVGFAPAARNFVSAYLSAPPCLDGKSFREVPSDRANWISVQDESSARACLAVLLGEVYFWYWLVRGDGFDVTRWIVEEFLVSLGSISEEVFLLLSEIGDLLHQRRYDALAFKLNAGKFVGNFNYRNQTALTRRADMLFLTAIGATSTEVLQVFDHVQRVLAINVFAGEKGIPDEVKAKYPPLTIDEMKRTNVLGRIDDFLMRELGFSRKELDFLLEGELSNQSVELPA